MFSENSSGIVRWNDQSILPLLLSDIPHFLKTCKANSENWYLQLNNERGCLSLFYTLRKRADPEVRKNVKTYLKSNDYVRNRDCKFIF